MTMHHDAWRGEIGCEGGPVIVANLDDFRQWRGSDALDVSVTTEVHFWSQFTNELPEQWRPNGPTGHQYLPSAHPAVTMEQLMTFLAERWPGTVFRQDGFTRRWQATRPDGKNLTAVLSPESEYDRVIRDLDAEAVYPFGQQASGYFWSVEPGMIQVHVCPSRHLMVLSQIEFADDDADAQQACDYVLEAGASAHKTGARYRVTGGPVVVAWSPNSSADLAQSVKAADVTAERPGMLLDMATDNSGALVWLAPGLYESQLYYHEDESWGVSWCRFARVED